MTDYLVDKATVARLVRSAPWAELHARFYETLETWRVDPDAIYRWMRWMREFQLKAVDEGVNTLPEALLGCLIAGFELGFRVSLEAGLEAERVVPDPAV